MVDQASHIENTRGVSCRTGNEVSLQWPDYAKEGGDTLTRRSRHELQARSACDDVSAASVSMRTGEPSQTETREQHEAFGIDEGEDGSWEKVS